MGMFIVGFALGFVSAILAMILNVIFGEDNDDDN